MKSGLFSVFTFAISVIKWFLLKVGLCDVNINVHRIGVGVDPGKIWNLNAV